MIEDSSFSLVVGESPFLASFPTIIRPYLPELKRSITTFCGLVLRGDERVLDAEEAVSEDEFPLPDDGNLAGLRGCSSHSILVTRQELLT